MRTESFRLNTNWTLVFRRMKITNETLDWRYDVLIVRVPEGVSIIRAGGIWTFEGQQPEEGELKLEYMP